MNWLYIAILLLAPFRQANLPSQSIKTNLEQEIHAYARAAGLPSLTTKSGFSLRMWSRGYMLGRVHGMIVSHGELRLFNSTSTYGNGRVHINAAQLTAPQSVRKLGKLKALVAKLVPYTGTATACGVMDGRGVTVHAVINGHLIMLEADNPDFCADKASKTVVKILELLHAQTASGVSPNTAFKPTPNRSAVRRGLTLRYTHRG